MRATVAMAAILACSAAPATAISVRNPGDLFTGATLTAPGQFSGVVGVQTQTNAQFAAGRATVCSGAVIGARAVLTAAHCIQDDTSGIKSVKVFLPQFAGATSVLTGVKTLQAPGYTGNFLGGYDVGIVRLGSDVPVGTQVYRLDTGSVASDLGTEEMVGLGTLGAGAFGDSGSQDGFKRYGFNQYETTFDAILAAAFGFNPPGGFDVFGGPKGSRLAYDFDDGTAAHDVFGKYLGLAGLGYADGVHFDTAATFGDSGAPHFENGRIVGISSFGVSGALFEGGTCAGPGNVDPSADAMGGCTNSSFGEIGVDTRVAAFRSFIAGNIPEPATWSLMIAGFGLVGGAVRRQRAVA